MRLVKRISVVLFFAGAIVLLTSAVPANKGPHLKPIPAERIKAAGDALTLASKDGSVTYQELKTIATDLKGEKLSLKEKIGLKIFGKRIRSKSNGTPYGDGSKSQLVALLLCIAIGTLGIHRFYLGYTWQGVVQLLTLGGCGIWALVDLIRIIMGTLKPKDGEYDETL